MAEKKKQHFVPKFYMRQFADSNKKFSVFLAEKKTVLPHVPYESQCSKNYFYGSDAVWENKLSTMEGKWAKAIGYAAKEGDYDEATARLLKQYAIFQRLRTPAESDYRKQEQSELYEQVIKMQFDKENLDDETKKACSQIAKEGFSVEDMLDVVNEQQCLINDLQTLIIEYKTKERLISSDTPVVAINPFHMFSIGLGIMGLILFYPISAQRLVVIYDAKMYPKYRGHKLAYSSDGREVVALNDYQLVSASKILFGSNEDCFSAFSDEAWRAREELRERKAVQVLGTRKNKMLIQSQRQILLDHELSFGQIRHSFKRIPFICREAVPRLYEDGWAEKLNIKEGIIMAVRRDVPDAMPDSTLTDKELRRGYRMMERAAAEYWNK